jgi:5-methylcytosine-specific restriction endonuclease McrA
MSFQYELSRPGRRRFPREQLLKALRQCARRHRGRSFRTAQFDSWPNRPCCAQTIIAHFGTWNKALAAINLRPVAVRGGGLDPALLIGELERVWRFVGHAPRPLDMRRHGRFAIRPYTLRWRSIRHCCALVAAHRRGEITRRQLLASAQRVGVRKTLSPATRLEIFQRDRFRCTLCADSPATNPICELHIDHILPICRGGGNERENLRTLCRTCNQARRHGTGEVLHTHAPHRRAPRRHKKMARQPRPCKPRSDAAQQELVPQSPP